MATKKEYIDYICKQLANNVSVDKGLNLTSPVKQITVKPEASITIPTPNPLPTNTPPSNNGGEQQPVQPPSGTLGKPVMIGDSWAKGMEPNWKGDKQSMDGAKISTDSGRIVSAATQIKRYLAGGKKPEFILCYVGRNANTQYTKIETLKSQYTKLIENCSNGGVAYPIYLIREQYDCHNTACHSGDYYSKKLIDNLNTAMTAVCEKHNNATFVDVGNITGKINNNTIVGANYMQCCYDTKPCKEKNQDNCSFHLTSDGYKKLLSAALTKINKLQWLRK